MMPSKSIGGIYPLTPAPPRHRMGGRGAWRTATVPRAAREARLPWAEIGRPGRAFQSARLAREKEEGEGKVADSFNRTLQVSFL